MVYHSVGSTKEPKDISINNVGQGVVSNRIAPQVFSIGPHFVYIFDHPKGVIVRVSHSFTDILGYNPKILLETGVDFFYQITHPDDRNQMIRDNEIAWLMTGRLRPETRKKVRMSTTSRFRRKDGSYLNILTQTMVIQSDDHGGVLRTLNICTDMTNWQRTDGQSFTVDLHEGNDSFVSLTKNLRSIEIFSEREKEILRLLASGHNSKSISSILSISYHTVNTHRKNMLRKIKVKNTSELIGYALNNKLI